MASRCKSPVVPRTRTRKSVAKNRVGRPRKSVDEKQSIRVVLHLTPAEKKRLDALAAKMDLPVATAARIRALGSSSS